MERSVLLRDMDVPEPTSVRGVYVYFMLTILVMAFLYALYVAAAYYGLVPRYF